LNERIEQIAEGQICVPKPELIFVPDHLSREVPVRAVIRLDVAVVSRNRVPFEASFWSTNDRVRVLTENCAGLTDTLRLEIHTADSHPGDVIAGDLQIVSNEGERTLPFSFRAQETPAHRVRPETLQAFALAAQQQPEDALAFFQSPEFLQMPFLSDPRIAALYGGVQRAENPAQGMETFLIAAGLKKPVSFSAAASLLEDSVVEAGAEEQTFSVRLTGSTWGYLQIRVRADVPWLVPDRPVLTRADFQGTECVTEFSVRRAGMHSGHNWGRLIFSSDTETHMVTVHAHRRVPPRAMREIPRKNRAELCRTILEYLNASYAEPVVLSKLERMTDGCLHRFGPDPWLNLVKAWIYTQSDKGDEAEELLEWIRPQIERQEQAEPEQYCFYQYLRYCSAIDESGRQQAAAEVQRQYDSVPGMLIALLELIMNMKCSRRDAEAFLNDVQNAYGNSPLVYAFSARLYRAEPDLMKKESPLALYTFDYMQKYGCSTPAVDAAFLTWTGTNPGSDRLRLRLLFRLAKEKPSDQLTSAVCRILIRRGDADKDAFDWYARALADRLELAGLDDAFLNALPEDYSGEIPRDLLMYFGLSQSGDDRVRLNVYQYVLCRCADDEGLQETYRRPVTDFAIAGLLEGKCGRAWAPLYEAVLTPDLIDSRLAGILPGILYAREITTKLPEAVRVFVHYPQLIRETEARLKDGKACVPVCADNAVIFFEDRFGNRYTDPDCTMEPLFSHPDLVAICRRRNQNHEMLLLEQTEKLYTMEIDSEETCSLAFRMLSDKNLQESFRTLLMRRAVGYLYRQNLRGTEAAEGASADFAAGWVASLAPEQFAPEDRRRITELLIEYGRIPQAVAQIKKYGTEGIRPELLLRLTSRLISEAEYGRDSLILELCRRLLAEGEVNDRIIRYLALYYRGTTESCLALLKQAEGMHAEMYQLPERTVIQVMVTGRFAVLPEAWSYYQRFCEVTDPVHRAYLAICCHRTLTEGIPLPEDAEAAVEELLLRQHPEKLPAGFPLALLCACADHAELSDKSRNLCETIVYEACAEGRFAVSFEKLSRHIELPHQMEGIRVAEWKGKPGLTVHAEGRVRDDAGEQAVSFPLAEIYPGIYTAPVFLYPGQTAALSAVSAEGTFPLPELSGDGCYARKGSLYDRICREIRLACGGSAEKLLRLMSRTEREIRVAKDLFPLL